MLIPVLPLNLGHRHSRGTNTKRSTALALVSADQGVTGGAALTEVVPGSGNSNNGCSAAVSHYLPVIGPLNFTFLAIHPP